MPDFATNVFKEFEKTFKRDPQVNLVTLKSYMDIKRRNADVAGVSINYELGAGDSTLEIKDLHEAYKCYEVTHHQRSPEPRLIAVRVFWTLVVGLREEAKRLQAGWLADQEQLRAEQVRNARLSVHVPVALPDGCVCPITRELIRDPVFCGDGHTYERDAISAWLRTKDTSPKTGCVLESKVLIPNFALRSAIDDLRRRRRLAEEDEDDARTATG